MLWLRQYHLPGRPQHHSGLHSTLYNNKEKEKTNQTNNNNKKKKAKIISRFHLFPQQKTITTIPPHTDLQDQL